MVRNPKKCGSSVEGSDCKRPIQCLASSKIFTPHAPPHRPASEYPLRLCCGGRTHSLGKEGVGGQYFGRRHKLLYSTYVSRSAVKKERNGAIESSKKITTFPPLRLVGGFPACRPRRRRPTRRWTPPWPGSPCTPLPCPPTHPASRSAASPPPLPGS